MNLLCVICADLLGPSDDVHVTNCGHLFHCLCLAQWLQRSQTCPQCRTKPKSIHKIYFTIETLDNLDTSELDTDCLQSQLDDMIVKLQCDERKLEKSNKKLDELKDSHKECECAIVKFEESLIEKKSLIQDQLNVLRSAAKVIEEQQYEIENLSDQMELFIDSINTTLASGLEDVEVLIDVIVNYFGAIVVGLKRELLLSKNKIRKDRDAIKFFRILEEKYAELESENCRLKKMIESHDAKSTKSTKKTHKNVKNRKSKNKNTTMT